MNGQATDTLHEMLQDLLTKHGDDAPFSATDSLFLSGRLDSLSMINLIMRLEQTYGVDFANEDFEVELIDTLDDIATLLRRLGKL